MVSVSKDLLDKFYDLADLDQYTRYNAVIAILGEVSHSWILKLSAFFPTFKRTMILKHFSAIQFSAQFPFYKTFQHS